MFIYAPKSNQEPGLSSRVNLVILTRPNQSEDDYKGLHMMFCFFEYIIKVKKSTKSCYVFHEKIWFKLFVI